MSRRTASLPPTFFLIGAVCAVWLAARFSSAEARGEPRPSFVVAATSRGRRSSRTDLWAIGLRRNVRFRLTRNRAPEAAPQCTPNGRRVVYVSGRNVYSVPLRPARRRGKAGRVRLGRLPRSLWRIHASEIGHFVKLGPFGKWVALPAKKGVRLARVDNGKSRKVVPAACPSPKAAGSDEGRGEPNASPVVRVVHPVFWMEHRQAFAYVIIRGRKSDAHLEVGVYDVTQSRTVACHRLDVKKETKRKGSGWAGGVREVDRIEALWSGDEKAVAISMRARVGKAGSGGRKRNKRKARVIHRVFFPVSGKLVSPPKGYQVTRWHGWQERTDALLFTGRKGRGRPKLYAWRAGARSKRRGRPLGVARLSSSRHVVTYSSLLRTALLSVPGRKGCRRSRLVKVKRGRASSLIGWAVWSELLAVGRADQWGLFRAASRCRHKRPVLYLMRLDGTKLLRELPKRFRLLRGVDASQVSLCPRPRE